MQRRRIAVAAAVVTAAGAAVAFTLPSMAGTNAVRRRLQAAAGRRGRGPAAARGDAAGSRCQTPTRPRPGVKRAAVGQRRLGPAAQRRPVATTRGAWLGKDGTTLKIAVTDAALADQVTRGRRRRRCWSSAASRSWTRAKEALDAARRRPTASLTGWYVDVPANKVVVRGQARRHRRGAEDFAEDAGLRRRRGEGRSVTRRQPKPLVRRARRRPVLHQPDGGTARCSIGFSVEGGFVTAGHCGTVGHQPPTGFNRRPRVPSRRSVFPGNADMGFVEVNARLDAAAVGQRLRRQRAAGRPAAPRRRSARRSAAPAPPPARSAARSWPRTRR